MKSGPKSAQAVNAVNVRTWYQDTGLTPPKTTAPETCAEQYDVAIIGAGLAGLSLLLRLSKAGLSAVLLERDCIGAGASGRNGGFCTPGWAADEAQIRRVMGPEAVAEMADLAAYGLDWMQARMQQPDYAGSHPVDGALTVSLSGRPPLGLGAGERLLSADALGEILSTRRYRFGVFSSVGLHFHPLNFMRALAREALAAGGAILEHTALLSARPEATRGWLLQTQTRQLRARKLVLTTGGYGGAENRFLQAHLLPIRTYIGVTAPMPELLDRHIARNWAIADTRRAGNYYRRLADGRLLWGMAITAFGTHDPATVKRMVARDIAAIYPALAGDMSEAETGIDYGWGGHMAYAAHFLPYVRQIDANCYAMTGFGGHGMNSIPAAAKVLSDVLTGAREDTGIFMRIPPRRSFGLLGRGVAELSYRLRQTQDALAARLL